MKIEPLEISPQALDEMMRNGEPIHLIDVRAGWEHEKVALPGNQLIPLYTLGARAHELDREKKIVVYCHHGVRSYMAAVALREAGFEALSLAGGIDRWAAEIDPAMKRY
jgi:rhodanese-related sulfurtransferase